MILFRKIKTVLCIIARCTNWPELAAMRLGFKNEPHAIRLRNGLTLCAPPPLSHSWGAFFEATIADVYGIRSGKWDVIIDIGGNLGGFSALAAFHHPKARIMAFEPNQEMEPFFKKNMETNHIMNVELVSSPLTKDGREVVFSIQGNGGSSGLFLKYGKNPKVMKSKTLDMVNFAFAKSVFLKLDCEGAEGEIIEWVSRNILDLPPRIKIACEYHPWCPVLLESAESILQHAGFICSRTVLFDESYLFAERGI
jgi:FkbM family methyltransferase